MEQGEGGQKRCQVQLMRVPTCSAGVARVQLHSCRGGPGGPEHLLAKVERDAARLLRIECMEGPRGALQSARKKVWRRLPPGARGADACG